MKRLVLLPLLLLATAQTGLPPARLANTQLPDPAKEAAAQRLMLEVRCLVCQGQSVADSDASMASDMRALIRQRIAAGESADDVRAWLIERYGDYITYNPPLSPATALLWALPLLAIVAGLWLARGTFRRRQR